MTCLTEEKMWGMFLYTTKSALLHTGTHNEYSLQNIQWKDVLHFIIFYLTEESLIQKNFDNRTTKK